MDHGAEAKRKVRQDMHAGNHFPHRQRRDRRERMMEQFQRGGALPGAFHRDVFTVIAHQFTDACGAIHVRNDLEQKVRRR